MKQSRLLLASILIVLGLLLSGTSPSPGGSAKRPPTTSKTSLPHEAAVKGNQQVNNREPPQLPYSTFETALIKTLSAIVKHQQTEYDGAAEKRWWPPTAAWAVFYATIAYVCVAFFQLRAISRQADTQEKALVAIERPYMLLWSMGVQPDLRQLTFGFENPGRTPAFIKKLVGGHVALAGDLPSSPQYETGQPFPPVGILVTCRRSTFIVNWDDEHRLSDDQVAQIRQGTLNYDVFGYIAYCDAMGNEHKTGFAGRFVPSRPTASFDVVNNPAYNYVT